MNRREFLGLGSGSLCASALGDAAIRLDGKMNPITTVVAEPWNDGLLNVRSYTLEVGATAPFRAVHFSDTHINLSDIEEMYGLPRNYRQGVNDKGLVTRNRRTKKDVFHFYQTNWRKDPQLYLCSKRMVEADAEKVDVMGFSNVGDVTLFVNGEKVGTAKPDTVCTVEWKGVPIKEGYNSVELRAGNLSDACTWHWTVARIRSDARARGIEGAAAYLVFAAAL